MTLSALSGEGKEPGEGARKRTGAMAMRTGRSWRAHATFLRKKTGTRKRLREMLMWGVIVGMAALVVVPEVVILSGHVLAGPPPDAEALRSAHGVLRA